MIRANKAPRQRKFKDRPEIAQTRRGAIHERNPAGSKLIRRFYRAHAGVKDSLAKSLAWHYRQTSWAAQWLTGSVDG